MTEEKEKLLTVPEAANKGGVSQHTVRRWIKEGKLTTKKQKTGGNSFKYLINEKELKDFLEDNFKIL